MNKDTIAGIVVVTGIVLAIGVLVFGSRSQEVASIEPLNTGQVDMPQVTYTTIARTEVEQTALAQSSPPPIVSRAANQIRAQQARQIADLEPSDKVLLQAALEAEAIGYRRGH